MVAIETMIQTNANIQTMLWSSVEQTIKEEYHIQIQPHFETDMLHVSLKRASSILITSILITCSWHPNSMGWPVGEAHLRSDFA